MVTYKERQQNKKYYVLLENGVPLGTFGNLKKITEYMDGKDFPSYWTLIRKSENPLKHGIYTIYKVKHY
ncbi:hypothetical protein [Flagellimonas sp. CMM7]|uniref:hypothetical protein n=1 Tax=Flagellimonas sp. CMM7 TaxID=2654676 RepID=UPI0013D332BE|nr:hypothetical protein [Flagellimonas sp. CMM7]UII81229.1 hypothetical protein LV704_06855 [Flagellimonas sp. CMM7]